MEKAIVQGRAGIETSSAPVKEETYQRKLITPEQKSKIIQDNFKKELGRELTPKELSDYLYSFNKGYTNFWLFLRSIELKEKQEKEIFGGKVLENSTLSSENLVSTVDKKE